VRESPGSGIRLLLKDPSAKVGGGGAKVEPQDPNLSGCRPLQDALDDRLELGVCRVPRLRGVEELEGKVFRRDCSHQSNSVLEDFAFVLSCHLCAGRGREGSSDRSVEPGIDPTATDESTEPDGSVHCVASYVPLVFTIPEYSDPAPVPHAHGGIEVRQLLDERAVRTEHTHDT
jgi:hypothetical protein